MMGSVTQGDPLPNVTQTTTSATEAPGYFSNYLSGLAQAGQSSMYQPGTINPATGTGTLKTGQELVAGYDPMQESGYGKFESAAGAYKPGLETAKTALGAGTDISGADINKFMNPYTQNVVDEMARLSQQNLQRNLLPTMKAGFVGSGALGSQRYAGALGQALADTQANLTGQQFGALSSGYKQALDAAMQEAGLQQKSAALGADIAGQEQGLGLTGASALTKAGAERQQYQQSVLDAPLKQASNAAALMRGYQVPVKTTETFVGPKAGLYQMSPLQQVMGIGSLLGAAKQGSLLDKLGSSVVGKLFTPTTPTVSTPGSNIDPTGMGGIDPDQAAQDAYDAWVANPDSGYSWLTDYE